MNEENRRKRRKFKKLKRVVTNIFIISVTLFYIVYMGIIMMNE